MGVVVQTVDGENARLRDASLRAQWTSKCATALECVEDATKCWIVNDAQPAAAVREYSIGVYRAASIEADPYVRPRTVYHRHGNLLEDGTALWHYESAAADQVVGTPARILREEVMLVDEKGGVSKDADENAAVSVSSGDYHASVRKVKEQARSADGRGIFSERLGRPSSYSAL